MTDKILRCRDVQEATGLSRSTIYRMMERDDFPKATKLGLRAIGWRQSTVRHWIETRSGESQAGNGGNNSQMGAAHAG